MSIGDWLKHTFPDLTDLAIIQKGGQKLVYSARHATEGDVVIKVILPGQDLTRTHREILAVQKIQSPRVPRILDVGTADLDGGSASIWLLEQRVLGLSVRQVLAQGPMSTPNVARLMLHVLEPLADAEKVRIVHRDVKPENIMRADDGSFWLLDFGIARHLDLESATATGAIFGPSTIGYAPPEQFRNRKREIDGRTDLFAVAVTAVECLTGRNPFRDGARDVREVLQRVETVPLAIPPILGDIDGAFRDLIGAMGQSRVDPRPATAAAALDWMREVNKKCGF